MPISNSYRSYTDCYSVMDQALADTHGARVQVEDDNAAKFFRMRCHQARSIDRQRNAKTYQDPDHPLHGSSIYDELIVRIREDDEGTTWVYIEKCTVILGKIEGLAGVAEEPKALPAPAPVLQITEVKRRI